MNKLVVNFHDIKRLNLQLNSDWTIKYHGLFEIQPDLNVTIINSPSSPQSNLWDLFFTQDLLQVENSTYLIDIGWIPDSDPLGNFVLTLLHDPTGKKEYNWEFPTLCIHIKRQEMLMRCLELLSLEYSSNQDALPACGKDNHQNKEITHTHCDTELLINSSDHRITYDSDRMLFKKKPFTGTLAFDYDNDRVHCKELYKNGLANGTCKTWHKNGLTKEISNYLNGVKHGNHLEYWEDGTLMTNSQYEWGIKLFEQNFDEAGSVWSEYKIDFNNKTLRRVRDVEGWQQIGL